MPMSELTMLPVEQCVVCGDDATSNKQYGATTCHSCRVFFHRAVKAKEKKSCRLRGDCPVNKFTRTQCRACRLAQCVRAGMQKMGKTTSPLLPYKDQRPSISEEKVNRTTTSMASSSSSSKEANVAPIFSIKAKSVREGSQSAKFMRIAVITTTPRRMNEGKREEDVNPESPRRLCWVGLPEELSLPTLAVTCSFIPEKLSTTLNLAAEAVVPKLTESVIEPLISMDLFALSRVKEGHRAWYPNQYGPLYFQFYESIVREFLGCWLHPWPSFLAEHTNHATITLCGLVLGLEQCFAHRGFYEQSLFSFPVITHSMARLWGNMYPMEEDSQCPGITMEGTENLSSPWARHIDDEHFVSESMKLLADVVEDDPVTARLLTFLLFFSTNNVVPTCEGAEHLLGREKNHIQEQLVQHLDRQGRSPQKVDEILSRMTEVGRLLCSSCLLHSGDDAPCEDWMDIQL